MGSDVLRIGNAYAFWGDDSTAAARLAEQVSDLDWLTLDFLAEVSMSILAKQRQRDPQGGFARDFIKIAISLAPFWRAGRKLRVVTNAGGLNPRGLAEACIEALRQVGCPKLRIAVVSGDDVLEQVRGSVDHDLVTANAYLGAEPLVETIRAGADLIVTGRVADPSLTVAPCAAHFGWSKEDYHRLAGATIAGHLIECGTQVTGGISTDWLDLPDPANIGYPVAEVSADGSCVITKPAGTGGRVTEQTVKEQLLYEIGDPDNYLSPDATVSFLSLGVDDQGNDRVRVVGAVGRPPPPTYKVSATYHAGYRASGMLVIMGRDARAKARRCGEIVASRLERAGCKPHRFLVESLGASDDGSRETVLRITASDPRHEVVDRFTREIIPLITSGPQGITGYSEGRPSVREVFGYHALSIPRQQVRPRVDILEV